MSRNRELNELIQQAGLAVEDLAALIEVSPMDIQAWVNGECPIPASLFTFLRTYLDLKSISEGVSCPLPR